MSKNIVVLSDGTAQDGGKGHDSNVYKLYRMLEDRTENQIVFYDQGLGGDWRKISENVFGVGFTENIVQCYRFIFENYNAGDKIYLFGYSRGAATVRSLASFLHFFGILPKSRSALIEEAFKLYETGRQPITQDQESILEEDNRKFMQKLTERGSHFISTASDQLYKALRNDMNDKANQFTLAHPNMWAEVEFLGVWDTVPALGFVPLASLSLAINYLPGWKHSFHDFTLHRSVKNAYQALSIDDDRVWFLPTIWNQYGDENKQKIKQVWFSGSHTDVGGGYREAGLSDIALEWLIQCAKSHGLRLYFGSKKYWNFCIAPDETDIFHPPREGAGRFFKAGSRDKVWDKKAVDTFGPPVLHESVIERARQDPNYRPWILTNYGEYPDPQKWLNENRDTYLHAKYNAELNKRYQEWCTVRWNSGEQNLPDIEVWLVVYPFPYEHWLLENRAEEQNWLEKNDAAVIEFEGRKFLVKRSEKSTFRDYDKETFHEKLDEAYYDQRANDNLWRRAMNDYRFEYDQKRWNKSKDSLDKK